MHYLFQLKPCILEELAKDWMVVCHPNIPATLALTFNQPIYNLLESCGPKWIVKIEHIVILIPVKFHRTGRYTVHIQLEFSHIRPGNPQQMFV